MDAQLDLTEINYKRQKDINDACKEISITDLDFVELTNAVSTVAKLNMSFSDGESLRMSAEFQSGLHQCFTFSKVTSIGHSPYTCDLFKVLVI